MVISWPFALAVIWLSFNMLAKYFYLTNAYDEIFWISNGNAQKATTGAEVFAILFPCGAVFTPVTSWLLDKRGVASAIGVMAIVSIFYGVFSVIPNYPVQVVFNSKLLLMFLSMLQWSL